MLNRVFMGLNVLMLVASLATFGCTKDQGSAAPDAGATTEQAAPTDAGAPLEGAPVEGSTEQPAQ